MPSGVPSQAGPARVPRVPGALGVDEDNVGDGLGRGGDLDGSDRRRSLLTQASMPRSSPLPHSPDPSPSLTGPAEAVDGERMAGTQLVWLKRDLRLRDHGALHAALQRGPVVLLYVWEPSLWSRPELDPSHFVFIDQALAELEVEIRERGGEILYRVGELPEVLDRLHAALPFEAIHAHEETGLGVTWARDKAVARWGRSREVRFVEHPQHGVFRPHPERSGWAERWHRRMFTPLAPTPTRIAGPTLPAELDRGGRPQLADLGLEPNPRTETQDGRSSDAEARLESFLDHRGENYARAMSSPVTAWTGCSRLSPHLAFGTLSMRTVVHAVERRRRRAELRREAPWQQALEAFGARLRWRDHFTQKLEDEPAIEFENGHRGYDGLRNEDCTSWSSRERASFDAWIQGRTGFPMVDACMRCLERTGWVNFRMRAMLASFATHHLWLHWREPAVALAPRFLDFEPGIHFAQFQMQAGTMGINQTRVYNVEKQAAEQDPEGAFIRRWVPELEGVPLEHLPAPYRMSTSAQSKSGCVIGKHYPAPIVDHAAAARRAKTKLEAVKQSAAHRAEAQRVAHKHGSRRTPTRRRRPRTLG